jgi:hypothetical protein
VEAKLPFSAGNNSVFAGRKRIFWIFSPFGSKWRDTASDNPEQANFPFP